MSRPLITLLAILTGTLTAFGQNGPGGVGSSSSLHLWIDATVSCVDDNLNTANDGDGVKRFIDLSGNGNDVNQSNSTRYGTLNTNQINGRSVVNFDGNNDRYSVNLGAGTLSDMTIFTVGKFDLATQPAGNNNYVYVLGNSISQAVSFGRLNANAGANTDKYFSVTEGTSRVGQLLDNSNHIYSQRFETTTPFHFFNVDGTAQTVDAHNSIITVSSNFVLGDYRTSGNGPHNFDGDLAELLFFEGINRTERVIVENWLAGKYNIALGTNSKYGFLATHPNDMAGIGQESATDNHTDSRGQTIVRINGATDLEDGEYFIWGHDGGSLSNNTADRPVQYIVTNGRRLIREWAVDISGGDNSLGTVDVTFDMTGIPIGVNADDYRILIDTDGDNSFINATVLDTAPDLTNFPLILFNDVPLNDGDRFTIGNSNDITTCTTLVSGTWNTAVWTCGQVPDSTFNVVIDDGTTVTIPADSTETANFLDVGDGGGGTLILGANSTLVVKGDLDVNTLAAIVFNSGSTLIMRGQGQNGVQTITNSTGSTIDLHNLIIENTDDVVLAGAPGYNIQDGLTLVRGDLTANTTLRFDSDATRTAHINPIPNGSVINGAGPFEVSRFRSARDANWGNIATSGVDTDLEDLNGEVAMSGIFGGNGYATGNGGGGFHSVYFWNNVTDAYEVPNNTSENFELGLGYEIWLADNLTNWGAQSWTLSGDINLADTDLDIDAAGTAWNLVGNPYLGFLDWDQITTDFTGIENDEYWYLDANLNAYTNVTAGGGATVPPGQGFWVRSPLDNTDLSLDVATHLANGVNSPTFLKRSNDDQLMIHVEHNTEDWGAAAYLRNDPTGFTGLDNLDITPLRVPDERACHMAILAGEEDLMVNYISEEEDQVSVPIKIETGTPGTYTMDFAGLDAFKKYQCVTLIDESTGESTTVSAETAYEFDLKQKGVSKYFTLLLQNENATECEDYGKNALSNNTRVWNDRKTIFIDISYDRSINAEITVHNILGEEVYKQSSLASYSRERIDLTDMSAGTYIVTVALNGQSETHKVILN
ncbi:MAG: hypothetical protein Salg2KO_17420 [Salibacteraceae bacterium]